jgi:hypothetical protein
VSLEEQLNTTLVAHLSPGNASRGQRLALDLTLILYHGEPQHDRTEIPRGEAKFGTNRFHAYASAYLCWASTGSAAVLPHGRILLSRAGCLANDLTFLSSDSHDREWDR